LAAAAQLNNRVIIVMASAQLIASAHQRISARGIRGIEKTSMWRSGIGRHR